MVWYPYRYQYWRRRRYWPRRRRARKAFRRKRHYRRVRHFKKKLKKIYLLQWQPKAIRKCHIKGIDCLCLFNQSRITFNSNMYKDSFVPPNAPGGGGFSIAKYTLFNLYDMHKFCSNWWTSSNDQLPLCRYLGCKIRCYQSELIDYVIVYNNSGEAVSNKLTYPSLQPSMMLMKSNKIIIPSRKTKTRKKPYYTIKIKPPTKLENKWYFQRDFMHIPLVTLYTTAVSLTQYYINTQADNNNITIHSLNTSIIQNHNFTQKIWPYKIEGTKAFYFYQYTGTDHKTLTTTVNDIKVKDLLPLTNIRDYVEGASLAELQAGAGTMSFTEYKSKIEQYMGNPFMYEHLKHQNTWLISETGPSTLKTNWQNEEDKVSQIKVPHNTSSTTMTVTLFKDKIINEYRYNPFKDNGKTTKVYLLKCNSEVQGWQPPPEPEIILEGFPLWLNIWGYVDFQIRLGTISNIMTNSLLVIQNQTTDPKTQLPIVPIDWDYLNGKSPFETSANPADTTKWWPQVQYQIQSLNNIGLTGPGTPKLYDKTSDQITIKYDFLFKWGGEPAKMINVDNPAKQPVFPVPRDECDTNSLQSPAQRLETLLYSFDERDSQLTKRAIERLKKDWDFTEILSSITEPTGTLETTETYQRQTPTETTQEKEKEKILQQLHEHHQQQQQLRLGIINLMKTAGI
nr:MAG: ORF1 [TTV-like mini virus]